MVSVSTLASLTIATLLIAALPVVLYRRLRPRFLFERREVILGIAVFAFFSMIVERALHGFVLGNATLVGWLANPAVFVAYGALAAGVCEEVGRFLAMKWLIRREPLTLDRAGTSLGYGIGHGGAEAWLVGVFVQAQWIVYAVLANRNQLDEHFTSVPPDALLRLHMVLGTLSPQYAVLFVVERAAAFVFQLGFSVLMWQLLRERFRPALPFLIVTHALIGLPAALFQARVIPLLAADAVYLVLALFVVRALIRYFRAGAGRPGAISPSKH
ncbi:MULTISPECIES: YhfC family intramembrane metalloprotease [unclassified Caballeronia]|uniref:YhfC family intramembrane metalloprotease n=1 Tax=unclassified Caballeronia TaxID=2646786 RepID=UPI002862F89B|nr:MULTISPECIES: YhfC family intramembrane metalloprotease [unclassified Caballeronia]MDR5750531.1 YhfC family intramembrane metalloprotease [Caballeronia sp. LZ024]MDR5842436.1 YhfC family intramembrane metalloprotease [Caballeronia sp. LZ031]